MILGMSPFLVFGAYIRTIGSQVEFYELKEELSEMQSQYESVLVDASQFPRAGSSNQRLQFLCESL